MRKIKITIIFLCIFKFSFSQKTDFEDKIIIAFQLFEKGLFVESIEELKPCLASEEVATIFKTHRLLAANYMELGQSDLASVQVFKMLQKNPNYKPSKNDRYRKLLPEIQKYVVIPKSRIGIIVNLGGSFSNPRVAGNQYTIDNYAKEYQGKRAFAIGTQFEYGLLKYLSAEIDLNYTQKSFEINYKHNLYRCNYSEQQDFIELPIFLNFQVKKINRFGIVLSAGLNPGYLYSAKNSITSEIVTSLDANSEDDFLVNQIEDVKMKDRRKTATIGMIFGTRVRLNNKNRKGSMQLGIEYANSLTQITDEETRYKYPQLINQFKYLDDNFYLDHFRFFIGYSLNLNYTVKKKNHE